MNNDELAALMFSITCDKILAFVTQILAQNSPSLQTFRPDAIREIKRVLDQYN